MDQERFPQWMILKRTFFTKNISVHPTCFSLHKLAFLWCNYITQEVPFLNQQCLLVLGGNYPPFPLSKTQRSGSMRENAVDHFIMYTNNMWWTYGLAPSATKSSVHVNPVSKEEEDLVGIWNLMICHHKT